MPKPVRVVFNADTGQFVGAVDAATGKVEKQSQKVAEAQNKVLQFGQTQLKVAQESGASQEKLTRIYEQTLSQIASVSETNAQRVIDGKDRIIEKNRQVAESQKQLAKVFEMPVAVEYDDVTNKQRASAVLRGGGVRAGEQFLTQFEVFNKLSGVLFPVLGAAALGKEIFHIAEGLEKVYHEAEHVSVALNEAFEQSHSKAQVTIDDLTVQADKLQDNIDKLHGHPGDGLKLALDEARRYADKLRESLIADRTELQKLFKEQNVGAFGSLLSGVAATGRQHEELLKDHDAVEQQVSHIIGEYGGKAAKSNNLDQIKALGKQRDAAIDAALQAPIDNYARERSRLLMEQRHSQTEAEEQNRLAASQGRPAIFRPVDNSAKIAGLDLASGRYQDFVNTFRAQNRVAELTEQNLKAEQDKANEKLAKEGNTKAREAARKAMEEQRRAWKQQDDARIQAGEDNPLAEMTAWRQRRDAQKPGSEQYDFANDKYTEQYKQWAAKFEQGLKESATRQQKAQRDAWDLQHDAWQQEKHRTATDEADFWAIRLLEAEKGSDNYRAAMDKYTRAIVAEQNAADEAEKAKHKALIDAGKQATAYQEASVALQEQTGVLGKHDAAVQLANIHAEQYRQQMVELHAELARQQKLDPASAASINAQAAIDKAEADRKVQVMQDAAKTAATTWQGAMRNANSAIVQDFQDTARQAVQFYQQALQGINGNIVEAMTGGKTDWSGMFKGLGKTLANTALEHAEAPLLKMFGVNGKNDGSDDNPFAVKIVGGGRDAGLKEGLAGIFGGGRSEDGESDGGLDMGTLKGMFGVKKPGGDDGGGGFLGGLGKIGKSLLGGLFGGHFALGGDVQAGVPIDVGEMGRETFVPKTAGTIVPNNKLGSSVSVYVDAKGSNNPAEIEAAAHRAVMAAAPHIVAAAAMSSRDQRARTPSSLNR